MHSLTLVLALPFAPTPRALGEAGPWVERPARPRRDRHLYDRSAQAKRVRVVSRSALEAARLDYCERCGTWLPPFEVHHIKTKGSGGDDARPNLINLCAGDRDNCHDLAHWGAIAREELLAIVAAREALRLWQERRRRARA